MTSTADDPTWMSVSDARKYLGVGGRAMAGLLESGRLTVRAIPGSYRRVLRADVERVAAEFTSPAVAS